MMFLAELVSGLGILAAAKMINWGVIFVKESNTFWDYVKYCLNIWVRLWLICAIVLILTTLTGGSPKFDASIELSVSLAIKLLGFSFKAGMLAGIGITILIAIYIEMKRYLRSE